MAKRRFWLPFGAPKLDALLWTTYTGWLTQTNPTYCVQRCAYSVARVYCEVYMCASHSVVSKSLRPHGLWPTRLLCPWDSPGTNTGVGCHALLQGFFPTQWSNLRLLHLLNCRWVLYLLSHWRSLWRHTDEYKIFPAPLPTPREFTVSWNQARRWQFAFCPSVPSWQELFERDRMPGLGCLLHTVLETWWPSLPSPTVSSQVQLIISGPSYCNHLLTKPPSSLSLISNSSLG